MNGTYAAPSSRTRTDPGVMRAPLTDRRPKAKAAPPVTDRQRSAGQLPSPTVAGQDFAGVKVHTDGPVASPPLVPPGQVPASIAGPVGRLLTPPRTGRALPPAVRTQAERAHGRDFGDVLVHDDPQSAADAAAVGAVAVTRGSHIFLARAAPALTSSPGQRLLAHELMHVRQQAVATSYGRLLSEPGDAQERAADAAARGIPLGDAACAGPGGLGGPVAALHRQGPAPVTPPPAPPGPALPPGGFQPEGFGKLVLDGTKWGEGQIWKPVEQMVVKAGEKAAEGAVEIGARALPRAAVYTGATLARAAPGAVPATGIGIGTALGVVAAVLLVEAAVIVVAVALTAAPAEAPADPDAGASPYGGTSPPGGLVPPATAPGAETPAPAEAPSAAVPGPAVAPGAPGQGPAQAPGPADQAPVGEPGPVDDPAECAKQIKAGKKHDHHIFPREYINEFDSLNIIIDDYTVTLNASEHIGKNGLHVTMDWNGEWADFFSEVPNDLTPDGAAKWAQRAIDKAAELMIRAKIDRERLHPYRRPKAKSPLPPKAKGNKPN